MSNEIAIRAENVSKSFKLPHNRQSSIKGTLINLIGRGDRTFETQKVLKDVSFEIKKGEFFGIVGRNGSGKSTLLKMLAGIYQPTKGKIIVNGSLTPFIELGVGFNPELTGRENVYLNGALLGFNRKEMNAMYDGIVEFAELERFMDQKLKNYSSGMQVRLAFSIAIRAKSDILLLDEVLAVGDAAFQAKCFDYFYELKRTNKTVIFISHDRGALERFCARGILIDDGKVITSGDIEHVLDAYTTVVLGQMDPRPLISSMGRRLSNNPIELISTRLFHNGKTITNANFGDNLMVRVELKFLKSITNPIVGATLWKTNLDNTAVYAANNLTEKLGDIGDMAAGERLVYNIKLPVNLNDGEYRVEVGVANASATNFYLQSRKALKFCVYGSGNPHSIVASLRSMSMEKKRAD